MAYMTWTAATMSIGIPSIDIEHRKLIDFINELHAGMSQGRGREVLGPILSGLIEYTRTHFDHEERLMREHGYPDLPSHRTQHEELTRRVLEVKKAYDEGNISLSMEVDEFLSTWLDHHIRGSDRAYGEFMKRNRGAVRRA